MSPAQAANQVDRFALLIRKKCHLFARQHPGLSVDDLCQDSCLWVYRWSLRRPDRDGEGIDFPGVDFAETVLRVEVPDLLSTLPPHMARRLEHYFLRGESSGEIGRAEGVTSQAVRQAIGKGLSRMRAAAEG